MKINKPYFFSSIGNALEFYDFALYGFYAQTLRELFIPTDLPLIGLFVVYGIFTVGFLSRPIGGFLFGFLGDKYGRKNALSFTLMGIGCATLGIAILPPYKLLGPLSPILLTLLRILQGVCLGGEWTNSLVFVSEYLNKYRSKFPALVTGIVSSVGIFGYFLASILATFFSSHEIFFRSWRIPFFLGSLVAILGVYFRQHLDDAHYEKPKATSSSYQSLKEALNYPKSFITVAAISGLNGALFFSQFIFLSSFLPMTTSFSFSDVGKAVSFGLFCYMILLPIAGIISDRYGHRKVMIFSALMTFFSSPLLLHFEMNGSIFLLFITQAWVAALLASWFAPGTFKLSQQFPSNVRCIGTAVSYTISSTLFGGLAPTISLGLYHLTKHPIAPAGFLACIALFSAAILFFIDPTTEYKTPMKLP